MFVDLGQAIRKKVRFLKNFMRGRKFNIIKFRENLFHFASHIRIEAIIIIDMKESAPQQIVTHIFSLLRRKKKISMTGHVHERQ